MHLYKVLLIALLAMLSARVVAAQTVRFETSLGQFEIELYPDKAPLNVANFLQYVNSGRYDNTVINRADETGTEDFVVQMGTFSSPTLDLPDSRNDFVNIPKFPPVQGEPAATTGLSNTRGTVGLALSGGAGGINQNSGTSSFFVNGRDNSFLDPDFSVFGIVADMTTIDAIFNADKIDPSHPVYQPNNLAVTDIPLQPNDNLVFITDAYVVIPEPTSALLCSLGMMGLGWRRRLRE